MQSSTRLFLVLVFLGAIAAGVIYFYSNYISISEPNPTASSQPPSVQDSMPAPRSTIQIPDLTTLLPEQENVPAHPVSDKELSKKPLDSQTPLSVRNYLKYKAQKGDTLGGVLDSLGICPIWGKNGKAELTIQLNSKLINKIGWLFEGTLVTLPVESLPNREGYVVNSDHQVTFTPARQSLCTKPTREPAQIPTATPESSAVSPEPTPTFTPEPTPSTSPEPSSTPTLESMEPIEAFKRLWQIDFSPILSLGKISGLDSSQANGWTLWSGPNYGLDVSLGQVLSKRFRLIESLGFQYVHINSIDSGFELSGGSQIYSHIGLGAMWKVFAGSNVELGGMFSYSQELYSYINSSLTQIQIDRIAIPKFELRASIPIFEPAPFSIAVDLRGYLLMPASTDLYKVNLQTGFRGSLSVSDDLGNGRRLKVDFFYSQLQQNSTLFYQSRQDFGLQAGYMWTLGY